MFQKIKEWFLGLILPALKQFFKAVFTKAKQEVISALQDIAVNAVMEAASTDLSNEEKRKIAFDTIKKYAQIRGIETRDSIINLVLEMALQAVKG